MSWPEAFAVVGVAWAFAAIVYFVIRPAAPREKWRPTGWKPPQRIGPAKTPVWLWRGTDDQKGQEQDDQRQQRGGDDGR